LYKRLRIARGTEPDRSNYRQSDIRCRYRYRSNCW